MVNLNAWSEDVPLTYREKNIIHELTKAKKIPRKLVRRHVPRR